MLSPPSKRKSRLLNEIDGLIIGTMSLISFSLYRAAHQLHHAYLASERDDANLPQFIKALGDASEPIGVPKGMRPAAPGAAWRG